MAGTNTNFEADALPFRGISDYEMYSLQSSQRIELIEKFENNGFIEYFRKHRTDVPDSMNSAQKKQYFDIDEFNNVVENTEHNLRLCHLNIRRIARNKGKLLAFLSTLKRDFDVILLTEVGDNAHLFLNDQSLSEYNIASIDLPTVNKYGGTAILVKKSLGNITPRDDLQFRLDCECSSCASENSWIELDTGLQKYLIAAIYRHHNGKISHFTEKLQCSLEKIDPKLTAFICGDTNINILNQNDTHTSDYYTTMCSHNFIPHILTPTRISDHSATCIDHIFLRLPTKQIDCNVISGNIISDITDHLPNFIMISHSKLTNTPNRPYVRLFGDKNVNRFKEHMDNTDWDQLLQSEDIDISTNAFYNHIFKVYDLCFPLVRLSRQRAKDKIWMTQGLINCTKKKDNLYKRQLSKPTKENIDRYKKYRNILNSLLDQAEKNYYETKISDKKNGIKNFWKSFGPMLNPTKTKSYSYLPKLLIDKFEVTGDQNIADEMNNYFCNVGKNIHSKLSNVSGHFNSYLKNKIKDTFFLSAVTEIDIHRELSKLNENKSSGPDNLKPKLAKLCKDQFVKPLTLLFNKSIKNAAYPSEFKLAKVIALYKKNSRMLPSNYRPISLLNCFNKILERVIYNQMMKFIDKHKILYINQYGFRAGFSTTLALIDVIDTIKFALDRNEYAIGIFLDLEKAFDTIDHNILLNKLEYYGFRGHVNTYIKSYLNNRKQYTRVNDKESKYQHICYGVPQGSTLGPLFFLLFINDIPNSMTNCVGKLFADDTSLILHHKNIDILIENAEISLKDISQWFKLNKLSVSLSKSTFLLFHNRQKNSCVNLQSLKVDNDYIPRCKHVKYIGLHLDENLSWNFHINELCNSLTKYFSVFYYIRNFANKRLATTIYYACIYSKISYGIEIYGTAGNAKLNKIQILQNKLMKLLTKRDYLEPTNQLHAELNILKVKDIHRHKTLQFVYNCISGNQIATFFNYFSTRETQNQLQLRNRNELNRRAIRTEIGRSTVQHTGATLWNDIPNNVKESNSIHIFKNRLFNELVSKYYSI